MIKIIKIKRIYSPRILDTDASILVYKYRPEKTGFNMNAEKTQQQLTFLALLPCVFLIHTLSDKALMSTCVNWTCHSFNGGQGHLKSRKQSL